jgi:hypothetical protein
MKRLLAILAVLLVILFIADNRTVSIPKKPPVRTPVTGTTTPQAANNKISNRIGHVWRWVTSNQNADGRRILIYVALAAALVGAVLRRSGATFGHVGLLAVLLVFLAEPLFVGFLGFSYYIQASNWQYTNSLIIGGLEAAVLALAYAATPQSS